MARGRRRWEELDIDCLLNVLGRVGMESLLFDVPFVCKSWHKASLDPSCWKRLIFPDIPPVVLRCLGSVIPFIHLSDTMQLYPSQFDPFIRRYVHEHPNGSPPSPPLSISALIKFVLRRSNGNATLLKLPPCCPEPGLNFVASACPGIKFLALDEVFLIGDPQIIAGFIGNFKSLETFLLWGDCFDMKEILLSISIHCKNFRGLCFYNSSLREDPTARASEIVNMLPDIRYLCLRRTYIHRDSLVKILRGCKHLERLHISDCYGFEIDDEILNLASGIRDFKCSKDFEGYYMDDDSGFVRFDENFYYGWDESD